MNDELKADALTSSFIVPPSAFSYLYGYHARL
jgi:hypothetical protein